jgi:branched-subunit amino acid transport protein AzlD
MTNVFLYKNMPIYIFAFLICSVFIHVHSRSVSHNLGMTCNVMVSQFDFISSYYISTITSQTLQYIITFVLELPEIH